MAWSWIGPVYCLNQNPGNEDYSLSSTLDRHICGAVTHCFVEMSSFIFHHIQLALKYQTFMEGNIGVAHRNHMFLLLYLKSELEAV